MDRFVQRQNIAHFKRLLAETNKPSDRGRHKMIIRLLADEIAKGEVVTPQGFPLVERGDEQR